MFSTPDLKRKSEKCKAFRRKGARRFNFQVNSGAVAVAVAVGLEMENFFICFYRVFEAGDEGPRCTDIHIYRFRGIKHIGQSEPSIIVILRL